MGQPDPAGLGRQPQKSAIGVERVRPTRLDNLKRRFLATIDKPLPDSAIDPVNQVQRVGAEACNLHDPRLRSPAQGREGGR